jgi:parvulin-like peptidyl-prolyl isomerase
MKKPHKKSTPLAGSLKSGKHDTKRLKKRMQGAADASKRVLLKRPRLHREKPEVVLEQAIQAVPRITNETVAEHREEVLSSARKYIYPLRHSSHKIVTVSVILFIAVVVIFFSYCSLALYKFQSTSGFIYDASQVIPFPVARVGSHFISYENYLFEIRHYIHYYQTQQQVDFSTQSGKQQLNQFRQQAIAEVVNNEYVDQLAQQNGIGVSDDQLNNEITLLQQQNRLGSNDKIFAAVLKDFWGWSITDFKRELKQQMLAQAVVSKLDVNAHQKAQAILGQLQTGADFATLAKQNSNDTGTSANGGSYGFAVDRTNRDISPQVINALFALQAGQTSGIIDTGSGLEIVKVNSVSGGEVQASHIFIAFNNIDTYINPLKAKEPPHVYIHVL